MSEFSKVLGVHKAQIDEIEHEVLRNLNAGDLKDAAFWINDLETQRAVQDKASKTTTILRGEVIPYGGILGRPTGGCTMGYRSTT